MAKVSELNINGKKVAVDADSEQSLLGVLRNDLDLIGCKYGCGEGQCGACTVIIDGDAKKSCITKVGTLAGRQITTIESLGTDGKLHPVQEAFLEIGALQCGYCTPGMVMASIALLQKIPNPTDADIVRVMDGNVCRCGTYPRIIQAIHKAASELRK